MKLIVRVEMEERYRIVGAIETKPGVGGVFMYDEQWADNGKGKPLSLSLPLEEQEFPGGAMKRYFEGLLPESDLLLKYSSSPAEDIARLFDMFLLNYFIGNCDAHLKNYSLIRSYDWRSLNLAPAYDLVSTTVYPGLTTAMGIYMGQKKKIERIDRGDLTDLAKTMGINAKAANRQIDAMRERLSNALASVPAEEGITQAIAAQATKRIEHFAQ